MRLGRSCLILSFVALTTVALSSSAKQPTTTPRTEGQATEDVKKQVIAESLRVAPTIPGARSKTTSSLLKGGDTTFVVQLKQPSPSQGPVGPASGGAPPVLPGTADQFRQAYEIASMLTDRGLTALSVRAMREALRNGPPRAEQPKQAQVQGFRQVTSNGQRYLIPQESGNSPIRVDQAFFILIPKWRERSVPVTQIYSLLLAAVLPESRPTEILTFSERRQLGGMYKLVDGVWTPTDDVIADGTESRGLGEALAELAVEAGQVDDLRARLVARAGHPPAEIQARILLAHLAIRSKDTVRATEALRALGERIKSDPSPATTDQIVAVFAPLLADPKYARTVLPYVVRSAENYASANLTSKAVGARLKVAGYFLRQNNETAARIEYMTIEKLGAMGRGGPHFHSQMAAEYLKVGWTVDALRAMGRHTDETAAKAANPSMFARRQEPTRDDFPLLVRQLLTMPADKRYAALKEWSLPMATGRRSIRYCVGVMPREAPPQVFGPTPSLPSDQLVSTMLLLVDAAKQCGKLQELLTEADALASDNVDNAELFRVLAYLTVGKGKQIEPALRTFIERARSRMTTQPPQPRPNEPRGVVPFHASELLFVTLCAADPSLASIGAESLLAPMLARATATHNREYIPRIRAASDIIVTRRGGANGAMAGAAPPGWYSATPQAVWLAQDGYVVAASQSQDSYLLLETPLTGTFEFSVDCLLATYAEGHVGYGGIEFEVSWGSPPAAVWSIGKWDQVFRPAHNLQGEQFNRFTVQVSPKKVRVLLNGKFFFEDTDPPPTSPWVMLASAAARRPVFRHFVLTGKPEVPAEVPLSAGDYLEGWEPRLYGGTLPKRMQSKLTNRAALEDEGDFFDQTEGPSGNKSRVYDWQAKAGEILGRRLAGRVEQSQPSHLSYFRALRPGESIRYEFFYEPGKTHVHPSLGRLAFMLEPEGTKLHWLTHEVTNDWTGLSAENLADDPAGRKGGALPLKPGEWNAVSLTTTAGGVKVELNGAVIYEGKISAGIERTFGFFHDRNKTAARIRNVVLSGQWPKAVPTADQIALTISPTTLAAALTRREQIGEKYYTMEAGPLVSRARELPPAERYKILTEWVLPTATRPTFQLAGVLRPLDVLGIVDGKTQPEGQRVFLGNRFEAPCLELVAVAREMGTLADLADRIEKAQSLAPSELFRRSKFAMQALTFAAQGKDAEAAAALASLLPFLEKMPFATGPTERWPDLVAIFGTCERPALSQHARALADSMNKNINQSILKNLPFDNRPWWVQAQRLARARAQVADFTQCRRPYGSSPGLTYWSPVSGFDSWSRSQGSGVPHWDVQGDTITHRPGHAADYLIFRVPLRGEFELSCQLRLQGWTEAHIRYGAYGYDLEHDRMNYRMHTSVQVNGPPMLLDPPLPPLQGKEPVYQYKLSVADGWYRVSLDGRPVYSQQIGDNADPWVMLHAFSQNTAPIKNLKITGNPTIPDKIDLMTGDTFGMWRPYLGGRWLKRGEEMYNPGPTDGPDGGRTTAPGFPEAAFYYQRPFLEDGAVDYEFYYDPDKALVHPALDRLVFLMGPDGVKLHWLTDGPHERSAVAFDNVTDEPDCRRGPAKLPLKPKAWNGVRVAVKGDTVKVSLNGTDVYERAIEATNQRTFGLFHYTDRTEARIRNVTLTGDWPRQLPAVDDLFQLKK